MKQRNFRSLNGLINYTIDAVELLDRRTDILYVRDCSVKKNIDVAKLLTDLGRMNNHAPDVMGTGLVQPVIVRDGKVDREGFKIDLATEVQSINVLITYK